MTKEMRLQRQGELSWSWEAKKAFLREYAEHMRWIQWRSLRQARRAAFLRCRSTDTEENFRPSSPNHLHVLAKEASDGDHQTYETFIKTLGLEATEDNIAAAAERFRVAFRPEGHNVHEWWCNSSEDARRWLRDELKRGPRRKRAGSLDLASAEKDIRHEDLHTFEDPDLLAFVEAETQRAKEAELRSIVEGLPERQHQFLMRRVEGLKYKEIAQEMGIDLSTVKSHARALRGNPDLRRLHEAW